MQLTRDYVKSSNGSANASLMTVQTIRSAGASNIIVNTVANAPTYFIATMGTPHTFTDPVTGETITIISEASAVDFAGHIDTGQVVIDEIAPGYTDLGSKVGDIIVIKPTTRWADVVAEYLTPTGMIAPFAGASAPSNWLLCDGSSLLRTDYPRLFAVIGTTFGAVDGTHFNVPDMRGRSPLGVGTGNYVETIAQSTGVNTSNDQLTVSTVGGKQLTQGSMVTLASTVTAPGGLPAGTYYVIAVDSTHIKLASNLANAIAGTAIDITSTGSGNLTLTLSLTTRALGEFGGEENHMLLSNEMPVHNHGNILAGGLGQVGADYTGTGSQINLPNRAGALGSLLTTQNAGSGNAHNNVQPFLALNYIIKT